MGLLRMRPISFYCFTIMIIYEILSERRLKRSRVVNKNNFLISLSMTKRFRKITILVPAFIDNGFVCSKLFSALNI